MQTQHLYRLRARLTLSLAVVAVAGCIVQPATAAELATATRVPVHRSAQVIGSAEVPRIEGYRARMPRGTTGEPQLFDDARPSNLSFAAQAPSGTAAGPSAVAGSTETQSSPGGVDSMNDLAWSLECDADTSTAKPYCQEPTGYYWVHGDIDHRRLEWVVDPGNSANPQAPQYEYSDGDKNMGLVPAREVLVRVADGCGLHADGYTDEAGHYSVMFPSWCGEKDATVTLYSVSAPGAGKQVALGLHTGSPVPNLLGDLDDDPADYTVISGEVGVFNPEGDAKCPGAGFCIGGHELDRTFHSWEEGRLFEQGKFSRSGEVARSLTIMETTMRGLDYYRQLVAPSRLPQINLVLTDQALDGTDNTAMYSKSRSNMIYIAPWLEWSPFAVLHETGHYFDGGILVEGGLDNYGRWGEPMANLRAGMILGTPWKIPSNNGWAENMDVQGNWSEGAGEVVLPDLPASNHAGGPSQGWTWRILWDLHDGVEPEPMDFGFGDFDQWDGGGGSTDPLAHAINGVVMEYLPQRDGTVHPDYEDRGQAGPDLVDMLDGLACLYGMNHLQLGTLLNEVMGYPYDFAHCSDVDDLSP